MRPIKALLLLIILSFPVVVSAKTDPAYRHARVDPGYSWKNGLTIRFEPDEAQCRQKYGSAWRAKCSAPVGRSGQPARGISMRPEVQGTWQWQDANNIVFIPLANDSLQPGTRYDIDISKLPFPDYVRLDSRKLQCATLPKAATLLKSDFLVDPSPASLHRIFASIEFNFPVNTSRFQPLLELPGGGSAGSPDLVWNGECDQLNISWPVTRLPEYSGVAKIMLPGFGQIYMKNGSPEYIPCNEPGVFFRQSMPGDDELFYGKKARLIQRDDESLSRFYQLEIDLSLFALGKDVADELIVMELPEYGSKEALRPFNWSQAPHITREIIKKGTFLKPEPLQAKDARQTKFRFKIPVKPGRYVLVSLGDGLKSASGHKLGKAWNSILQAEPSEARIGFLQPGNIIGGESKIDIFGNNIDEIDWKVTNIQQHQLGLLARASDLSYAYPLDRLIGTGIGIEDLGISSHGTLKVAHQEEKNAQFATLNLAKILSDMNCATGGMAYVQITGKYEGREVANAGRLVLSTNIGLLIKRGNRGNLDCFVHYLDGSGPAPNAKISILRSDGTPLLAKKADEQGFSSFDNVSEKEAVAIKAEQNGEIAWLSLRDKSRQLNYSDFDTGGAHVAQDGILAYVFNQRGIYRPGDTLYFGCMPRHADFSLLPADLPLFAEIRDPRGVKVWEKIFNATKDGLAELSWQSDPTSISGFYTLNIKTARKGDIIGYSRVRMEQFQPEMLKMKVELPRTRGWICSSTRPVANLAMQNLYGTPAGGHRIKSQLRTEPANFRFPGFEEYNFTDPAPFAGGGSMRKLPDMVTDFSGNAQIELPEEILNGVSARLTMLAEGFDAAGARSTTASDSVLVSPYSRLLGYKLTGSLTNLGFIPRNEDAFIELVAIAPDLSRVSWKDLRFSLCRRSFVTNLVSDGTGGYRYDDVPQEVVIREWLVVVSEQGAMLKLDTGEPGDFLLLAHDSSGRIVAQVPYTIAGERLLPPGAQIAGSKMRLYIDRDEYKSGQDIQIAFSLPYDATGLISIERDGVHSFKWIKAHAGDNIATIKIPDDFEGKGHIVAAFLRTPGSGSPYMTPLAYSVKPFKANMDRRAMRLKFDVPAKAQPGETISLSISADKAGKVAVFAVDEGILQMSGYQNPDPLGWLLGNRALDVATIQAGDLLMPERLRAGYPISAFGGGSEVPFGAKFQNPFKRRNEPPVAMWMGVFEMDQEPVSLRLPIPGWYNGQIRLVAVGSGQGTAGSASCKIVSAGDLVLTPHVPLAVSPGDEFEGALVIANTSDKAVRASVAMQVPEGLQITAPLQKSVELEAGEEKVLPFQLKASDLPGEATIVFSVPEFNRNRKASLSIRPATPMRTTLQAGISYGKETLPPGRKVMDYFANSTVSISSMPLPLAYSLGEYLDAYPYGCTEQLISRALGYVILSKWLDPSDDIKRREKIIASANNAIRNRFNGNGLALWPQGSPDKLLTVYAADYLLALRESGLGREDEILGELCDALSLQTNLNEPDLANARSSAYGIWILAREGRVVTQLLENLIQDLKDRHVEGWETDITAVFLAAAKSEMRMPVSIDFDSIDVRPDGWFDEYSQRSLLAYIQSRYFADSMDATNRNDFYEQAVMSINNNAYATFSACQGMRALVNVTERTSSDIAGAKIKCRDSDTAMRTPLDNIIKHASLPICRNWELDSAGKGPVFWQIATTGYDKDMQQKSETAGIRIERQYLNAAGDPCREFQQGEEIAIRISARSEAPQLKDCVINDILPGGFEMIIRKEKPNMPNGIKYIDRQEDRMLVFADLSPRPLEFEYRVRAVTNGKFVAPPIHAEAMYDQGVYGQGELEHIAVTKP